MNRFRRGALAVPFYLLLIVALFGFGACKGEKGGPSRGEGEANAATQTRGTRPIVEVRRTNVESLTLAARNFSLSRTYVGYLLPNQRLLVMAEIEGLVEKVAFEEGMRIQKGQIMAHISTRQFTVRRNLARSNLNLAKSNFEREKKMRTSNLIPQSQLDATQNHLEVARFNLELAELELEKSIVRAPITGYVKTRDLKGGEYARKGGQIAELLDLDRMIALVNVPEREIRYFAVGKPIIITLNALPGKSFPGKVKTVGLEADQKNRSFPVEVDIDNADGALRPGMLARVNVNVGDFKGQVLIPRHAILERENSRVVFVLQDGLAHERTIHVGASQDEEVQVLEGLSPGDALIVKGQHKLNSNDPVMVRKNTNQSL